MCSRLKTFELVSLHAVQHVEPGEVRQVGEDVPTMEYEVVIDVDVEGPSAWAPGCLKLTFARHGGMPINSAWG